MVGDDRQKIFSFAGAIEDAFESALHDFNSAKEVLTEVYRSTSNVVEAYSGLFENHPSLKNESVLKNIDIPILIRQTDKQNHDRYLKSCIKHLTEKCNVPLSEIAILSTSWFSSFNASKALRQHYNIVGPGALPHKSIYNSTFSLLKALSFYFYDPNPRSLKGVKRNIDRHILENNLTIQHDDITIKTNKLITGFQEFDTENTLIEGVPILKALFNHIFEIPHSTFDEIIDSIEDKELPTWSTQQYIEVLSGTSGIVNNTIHKAKGLEFDAVILNEMNENKIPYQKVLDTQNWIYEELTEKQIEEGRKLFYVALSRAKKYLIILHNWKPSMFIPVLNV
jgi:superfamily I DNA/RNA helicase